MFKNKKEEPFKVLLDHVAKAMSQNTDFILFLLMWVHVGELEFEKIAEEVSLGLLGGQKMN